MFSISSPVKLQDCKYPLVNALNISRFIVIFDRSFSSSFAVAAPNLIASPKSYKERPGITVSRSITQRDFLVSLSNKTLLSFVSL